MKKLIFILLGLIVVTALVVGAGRFLNPADTWVCQNGEWVKHGDPEGPPPQEECGEKEGERNPPEIEENIRISSPRSFETVSSPLKLEGEARGSWFFEGNFPVLVVDSNGEVLGEGLAWSQDDQITDEFVAFQGKVELSEPTATSGRVILEKNNPTGLLQNSERRIIMVEFPESDFTER